MNSIQILVISNKYDFTSDYVCLELENRKKSYLRINRDEFNKYKVALNLDQMELKIGIDNEEYFMSLDTLKSVYYRAPIYLRDFYKPQLSKEDQLFRTQWTAFIRNLSIFENIIWVNNPVATFKAENKLLQLLYAKRLGFPCPKTIVANTNDLKIDGEKNYIVKSLDTALLQFDENEAFVYSNIVKGEEIIESDISIAPITIQEYIFPKIDIRVTVIGNYVYSVKILKSSKGISGDWRRCKKEDIIFEKFELPENTKNMCIKIVKELGLAFGAIDLIESNNTYFFIEVNPTGEWAWLVESSGLKIHHGICNYLEGLYD